jgi:hypothetical protein
MSGSQEVDLRMLEVGKMFRDYSFCWVQLEP